MSEKRKRKGISLLEILVSLAVFSFVTAITGSIFYRVFNDWTKQKNYLRSIEEAQWALEFMSNEIRLASKSKLEHTNGGNGKGWKVGQRKGLDFETPDINNITYEWDGDYTLVRALKGNDQSVILRNGVPSPDGQMYLPKIGNVPPPLEKAIIFFNVQGGSKLTTLTITIRPNANQDSESGNKEYTVRTVVFPRNP